MSKTKAIVTCGLGFGDEGKGSIVDFLVRKTGASSVIRYSGGPQAAHYVITPDGREHCFSQFGSGTFVPGVRTHLSRHMLVKPQNLILEEEELRRKGVQDGFSRLSIDPECPIVTPYHAMLGQMLELSRGDARHGSVGIGVGQAAMERDSSGALRISDLFDRRMGRKKLRSHRDEKIALAEKLYDEHQAPGMGAVLRHFLKDAVLTGLLDSYEIFASRLPITFIPDDACLERLITEGGTLVFEGSQGTNIDFEYGFWPYVTKTDTTMKNAGIMLEQFEDRISFTRIGILRGYSYRHGPGPLVTEDKIFEGLYSERHNRTTFWQGEIRKGWLDLLCARYAMALNKDISSIALTHADSIAALNPLKICASYEYMGEKRCSLDDFFISENLKDDRIRITGIKPVRNMGSDERTGLLWDCRPLDFLEFSGEVEDIGSVKGFNELPGRLKSLIKFLESEDGLNCPVGLISLGPSAGDKICRIEM